MIVFASILYWFTYMLMCGSLFLIFLTSQRSLNEKRRYTVREYEVVKFSYGIVLVTLIYLGMCIFKVVPTSEAFHIH